MLQLKRKKAYTKMDNSNSTLISNTCMLVTWAKGMSCTSSAALSVVPSMASKPPMIRMDVDEKNDGVCDRFCVMSPSNMRGSREVAWRIQRSR